MNMQGFIVALIVLAALVRVAWQFIPARWRRPIAARLGLRAGAADAAGCHDCKRCSVDCKIHS